MNTPIRRLSFKRPVSSLPQEFCVMLGHNAPKNDPVYLMKDGTPVYAMHREEGVIPGCLGETSHKTWRDYTLLDPKDQRPEVIRLLQAYRTDKMSYDEFQAQVHRVSV